MAVRWGAGEETLTTCNMDMFPLDTLDETTGLNSEDAMITFQSCLDPSILSMFEDTPAIETRGLEEESEATLLSALTEILDNVDDENLSPFDTLPESELLSSQKGREHSPLGRLFCLSHSPPEKDSLFGKYLSTGKTLPMVQQRSDGEEEEDSRTPSPGRLDLSSDNVLLDWNDLPISFEQDDENGLSVNFGDLVRQMHPYCMAISLEDDKGEQMLPEGGILLEVVDQGENGEPILAIPEMDQTISVNLDTSALNSKVLDEEDDAASDSSEQIIVVVDDDDDIVTPVLKVATNKTSSKVKDKMTCKKLEDGINERSHSRRKRGKKSKRQAACPSETEVRVLCSSPLKNASHEGPKNVNRLLKDKRHKVEKNILQDSTSSTPTLFTKPKNVTVSQTKVSEGTITTISSILEISQKAAMNQSVPLPVEAVLQPEATPSHSVPTSGQQIAAPTSKDEPSVPVEQVAQISHSTTVVDVPSPHLPVTAEPKPKALSLAEYRRLRQQKKPVPMEKQDDNSTKWPSLPEPPKELPPIPHLPEPSPKDPRLSWAQPKAVEEEVKPAWMPRGPGVPPTPEALLAPPAYMVNAVNKAATKPQQTVCSQQNRNTSDSAPHTHTKEPRSATNDARSLPSVSTTTDEIKLAANVLTSVPPNNAALPETKALFNPIEEPPKSNNLRGQGLSPPVTQLNLVNQSSSGKSEESLAVNPVEAKSPTQELIEAFTSELGIEASDLTSLLEQFEETQAKEEQCLPEVSGRAVAVGNSSSDLSEKIGLERVRANDLSSTALTPPATPPDLLWKPLDPVSLLAKNKMTKSCHLKVIEIEAQPLPLAKARSRSATVVASAVDPDMACQDHDYCLPNKSVSCGEAGKRWNVKQHSSITIKPIKQNAQVPSVQVTTCATKAKALDRKKSSVLETPDASPTQDEDDDNNTCPKQGPLVRSYRQRASSRTPSPKKRSVGRSRVRRSHHSSSSRSDSSGSDTHSSRSRSRSYTPPRKRYRRLHSRSSSTTSSRLSSRSRSPSPTRRRRYSYTSSRSGSWSGSRSRSRSPQWSGKRHCYRDSYCANVRMNPELKRLKEKAIEERRVVYVGRIRGTMTQKELKERFSYFGEIEECTLHFRDHGDNYGFVTYYNTNNAFMAIEKGSKLRKPDEMPFDLCFGGRRQFCQTSYADLDSNKEYESLPSRNKYNALDFDTLLKQAQQNLKR
ncbi:uncharacterized protein pprc1 isoform X2 [Eucyclogobius newberryi]|uniref:uncharacterized protein pprc1 isoform X2 n=1 Tax=Eucyclogobius newberryi TaxID=166745 RepID=UPI003B5AFF08